MVDKRDWARIANYVTGVCSEDEKRAFEAQLLSDDGLRTVVDEVQRLWAGAERTLDTEPELIDWDLASAWQEFERGYTAHPSLKIDHGGTPPQHLAAPPVYRGWRNRISASALARPWIAAAAALAVVVSAALWLRAEANVREVATSIDDSSMYAVATKPSQRLHLRMPDGSRVVLDAGSTLRYPKTYGDARRDVYLDGRAYFEVMHDATKPFAVHTRHAVARDLGTRFGVRAYREDDGVELAVADGVVELARSESRMHADTHRVILGAGQLGRVDANGLVTSRSGADVSRHLAWTEGRLVFLDTPLREVLPELARWYDLKFELADRTLGARRFTGTFDDESVVEVLQFLTLSTGASYRRDGQMVTLIPNPLR